MQLSAVTLASYVGFVETVDLNPRGKAFFPEILPALVQKCHFHKFPKEYGEMDEQKGIDFLEGEMGRHFGSKANDLSERYPSRNSFLNR